MNREDKKSIYEAFVGGALKVLSSSKDKKVGWKRIDDVLKHDVRSKKQYKITVENGACCCATEDHSLYTVEQSRIREQKTGDFKENDLIACLSSGEIEGKKIKETEEIKPLEYMYDLSVEDNHNFFLHSGILAHNSFRPPSHEKFLQAQTQVFGYIWEDEELYEYLLMAVDIFNATPPVTGITLTTMPDRWRTVVMLRAAAFACAAVALNWIADEFTYSISGVSLDIEKSSKYESMKSNFIEEYEKAEEKAKRSIKIIKGLRQPRYGIGISSALGPYSRPGVQSRRNFISGFRRGWM